MEEGSRHDLSAGLAGSEFASVSDDEATLLLRPMMESRWDPEHRVLKLRRYSRLCAAASMLYYSCMLRACVAFMNELSAAQLFCVLRQLMRWARSHTTRTSRSSERERNELAVAIAGVREPCCMRWPWGAHAW